MAKKGQQVEINRKWADSTPINWEKDYEGWTLSLHRFCEIKRRGTGSEYAVVVATSNGPVVITEFWALEDDIATITADGVVLGLLATIL